MKKFISGLLVGVSISVTGSVFADDVIKNLIGKEIQGSFPVKINGKQLTEVAAVVDGTSYLPIRAMGEALNMDVKFNPELGIELQAKGAASSLTNTSESPPQTMTIDQVNEKIRDTRLNIQTLKMTIENRERDIKQHSELTEQYTSKISRDKAMISKLETELSQLEQQKAGLTP